MIHTFNKGDKVKVWPRPGLRVKIGPDQMSNSKMLESRTLDPAGEEVAWSEWFHDLAKGGALYFSDPRPEAGGGVRQAEHVHPQAAEMAGKE